LAYPFSVSASWSLQGRGVTKLELGNERKTNYHPTPPTFLLRWGKSTLIQFHQGFAPFCFFKTAGTTDKTSVPATPLVQPLLWF
jgi:hypothetical protein